MRYDYSYVDAFGGYDPEWVRMASLFVGPKAEHYLPIFITMRATGRKLSWNWSAFFTPYWFLYRRMYAVGSAVLALGVLFGQSLWLSGFFGLLETVLLGMFGNYLYYLHIDRLVTASTDMAEPYRSDLITRNIGVSLWAVVAAILAVSTLGRIFGNNLPTQLSGLMGQPL